jgi:outer membrane receptor protein involved in Fe transport
MSPGVHCDAGGGRRAHRRHRLLWSCLCAGLAASSAWAGTTGRIAGRVLDAKKQPLPGVTVAMIGVQLGALTDENGAFTILNIPSGTYSARAALLGYRAITTTNVLVSADETTRLDLVLEEAPVQLEEVVVSAKRPVVEVNRTSTVAIVPREEIQKLPVQELQDVVNLQAGVVDGHFRGGRQNEVQYQVDGLSTNNAYDNTNSVRVDRSLLEEVQVVSGTFDAEYGQAMSGVVNAVLRRGGDRFQWDGEALLGGYYYTTDSRGQEYLFDPVGQRNFQLTMSGPTGLSKTTFLANVNRHVTGDAFYSERRFTPVPVGDLSPAAKVAAPDGDGENSPLKENEEWSGILKLSTRQFTGKEFSYQAMVNALDGHNVAWVNHLVPDGAKRQRSLSIVHGLGFTHTLSPKRYYEIDVRQNYYDYRDMAFDDVNDPRYFQYGPLQSLEGYENNANVQGVDLGRFQLTTNAFLAKGTFVDQRSQTHQIKLGLEYQAPLMRFGAAGGELSAGVQGGTGAFGVNVKQKPQSEYLPVFFSGYAQDQSEWNQLTFRVGARFDWFDARTTLPSDLQNPANSIPDVPQSTPQATTNKLNVAPRIGVSYPVAPNAAIYFSYGHFYQYPPMRELFNNADYSVLADLQAADDVEKNGVLGNPDLRAQRTVQYQVGVKDAITSDLGLDVSAFYKDIRDLLGVEFVSTYNGAQYVRWTNVDFGSVIGLTLTLDQRALGPFAVSADYTWQHAVGNSSDPDETLNRAAAGQDALPRQIPFNWDQRHTFNLTVSAGTPKGFSGSGVLRFASGQPYTPLLDNSTPLMANSARKPMGTVVDLRAEHPVRAFGMASSAFVRVFNVFDSRFFNGFVFPSSGSPDYSRFSDPGQQAILADPTRYFAPRRIELGIALQRGSMP